MRRVFVRREFRPRLASLLLAATLLLGGGASLAQNAPSFKILNRSMLTSNQALFYYLGYGQIGNNFVVLGESGDWITMDDPNSGWVSSGWNPSANGGKGGNTGAGVVPCYPLTGTPSITIPPNISGARVYFFQVMSGTALFGKPCANTVAENPVNGVNVVNGIFGNTQTPGVGGQAPFSYFSTQGGGAMSGATISQLSGGTLPLWTYSEIGSGATSATIDTSQVDFIGFPMNVTAKLISNPAASVPVWNQGVGFSYSPNSQVNMGAVIKSYQSFVQTLPVKTGTGTAAVYPQANYANLIRQTPGGSIIVNPGNYLSFIDRGSFAGFFSNIVNNYMWKPGWTGSINTGGAFGPLPQVQFNGTTVQLASYPGYTGTSALYAIKFTASIGSATNQKTVTAYLLSPSSYRTLCKAGAISGGSCKWMSTAYQIFATDGALSAPVDNNQFNLLTPAQRPCGSASIPSSSQLPPWHPPRLTTMPSSAVSASSSRWPIVMAWPVACKRKVDFAPAGFSAPAGATKHFGTPPQLPEAMCRHSTSRATPPRTSSPDGFTLQQSAVFR